MADEIDLANEQAERWLKQQQKAQAEQAAANRLKPKGCCYYCDQKFEETDPLIDVRLFCDKDCAADYEEEKRLKNRR